MTRASGGKPTVEESLFNPAFMCLLLTRTVDGHLRYSKRSISIPLSFVAVAMSLDEDIRESLTYYVNSNIVGWMRSHPGPHARVPEIAAKMSSRIRPGLQFGLHYNYLSLESGDLSLGLRRPVADRSGNSIDMAAAQRAAWYLGRWFSNSGETSSIMTLLGVRL